jgi:CRISPR associated protein, Cas1 family
MPRFASRPRTGRDWNVCYVIVPGPSLPAITAKAPGSPGYGRNRRPLRDPINALLSLGYALALKGMVQSQVTLQVTLASSRY